MNGHAQKLTQLRCAACENSFSFLLTFAKKSTTTFNWPRQWENVEIMLIDLLGFEGWPRSLLEGLRKHRYLRHLCAIGEITSHSTTFYSKLSMKDSLNELMNA